MVVSNSGELPEWVKENLRKRDEAIAALFPSPDQAQAREIVKKGMNEMIGYHPDPEEAEISIHPAPGTCCPEMIIVNGRCTGCGHVPDKSKWGSPCQLMIDRACCFDEGRPGCFGRLDCEGYTPSKET
jgi:hypothetical protein